MLDEQGRFEFTEVLDLVERLWCAYQASTGAQPGRRERLAGLVYLVAALRQDVEAVLAELQASPELDGVDVAQAAAEALGELPASRVSAVRAEMQRRNWLD
jgi:hypothetical protein